MDQGRLTVHFAYVKSGNIKAALNQKLSPLFAMVPLPHAVALVCFYCSWLCVTN
jgi:hypothetical protein